MEFKQQKKAEQAEQAEQQQEHEKKIKNSTYYNNILKFKKLEATLIAEEVRINSDFINKKANII